MTYNKPTGMKLHSNRGFIISELMAMAIVLLSVSAIAVGSKVAFDGFKNYQIQTAMIERENYLIAALQSQEVLETLRSSLRGASVAAGTAITVEGREMARQDSTIIVDRDQNICATGAGSRCDEMRVDFSIRCQSQGMSNECLAAYRIYAPGLKTSLGADGASGQAFVAADYSNPIPFELAARETFMRCDRNLHMFASGFTKSTGRIHCVNRPTMGTCGQDQVARRVAYNSGANSILLQCESLKTIQCPTNYVLQRVDPLSLFPTSSAVSGSCVFGARASEPFLNPPPPAPSISGTFCPRFYRVSQNCSLVNVRARSVTCSYECGGNDAFGVYQPATCYYELGPNAGSLSDSSGGRNVSCQVIIPAQPSCNGGSPSWSADVSVTGSCLLTEPVNAGVL